MTKDKDEKAVIRARMQRTGESYAAARAQLARGGGEDEGQERPRPRGSFSTTPATGRAIQAAAGQSVWHLVTALAGGAGVAGRVLRWLGFPTDVVVPPLDEGSPAATSVQEALWSAAELKGSEPQVDTGSLLRGAVDVLDLVEVPPKHAHLVALLRNADLVGLCRAARSELGPEDDDALTPGQEGTFSRFTDRARLVIVKAQEEARGLGHGYIGTEHILLGLLGEGSGLAWRVLSAQGVELEDLRTRVEAVIGRGDGPVGSHIPFTPRCKKLLELAATTSLELGHAHVGTEHLLLALVEEGEGVGAQVLAEVGATKDVVRETVLALLVAEPPLTG